jgi:hypothetical protein
MKRYAQHRAVPALAALVVALGAAPASGDEPYIDPYILAHRAQAKSFERFGDLPLGAVIRGDERYGPALLFRGPRGWDYWNRLEAPKPNQDPNLWPDKRPTYLLAQLVMPAGSSISLHSTFPHARYFKLALYKLIHNTFTALTEESITDKDIEPDPDSINPYRIGAARTADNRSFTLHFLAQDPPANKADRAANTVYVGKDEAEVQAVLRVYLSDQGYDGAGWGPADRSSAERGFTFEGRLADGTKLSPEQIEKQFTRPLGFAPPPLTVAQWYGLVDAKDNDPSLSAQAAPARKDPVWENFWTVPYSVAGPFKTPEMRAKMRYTSAGAEAGADPSTVYMLAYLSRSFAPVYVFRGKMPTFPDTFAGPDGHGLATMPATEVRYWSVVSVAAAPSGEVWDGLMDMQVPLDKDGNYTIVVSRPEDRPTNATAEQGVAWMDWGAGEGLGDPRNRKDWGMLIMRFLTPDPNWEKSPTKVTKPGEEPAVMGPYYPRGYYTTKAEFEATGPKK